MSLVIEVIRTDSNSLSVLTKPPVWEEGYWRSEWTQVGTGIKLKVAITKGEEVGEGLWKVGVKVKEREREEDCSPTLVPEPSLALALVVCLIGGWLVKRGR